MKYNQINNMWQLYFPDEVLQVSPVTDEIIHVKYAKSDELLNSKSMVVEKLSSDCKFLMTENQNNILLSTKRLQLEINKSTGRLSCSDIKSGKLFLSEPENGHSIIKNEYGYSIRQSFTSPSDEIICGLGQQQDGAMNFRGIMNVAKQGNSRITWRCGKTWNTTLFWTNRPAKTGRSLPQFMRESAKANQVLKAQLPTMSARIVYCVLIKRAAPN